MMNTLVPDSLPFLKTETITELFLIQPGDRVRQ